MFGYDQPIQLNLLDIEPAMGVLGGVCMEIDDCADTENILFRTNLLGDYVVSEILF